MFEAENSSSVKDSPGSQAGFVVASYAAGSGAKCIPSNHDEELTLVDLQLSADAGLENPYSYSLTGCDCSQFLGIGSVVS